MLVLDPFFKQSLQIKILQECIPLMPKRVSIGGPQSQCYESKLHFECSFLLSVSVLCLSIGCFEFHLLSNRLQTQPCSISRGYYPSCCFRTNLLRRININSIFRRSIKYHNGRCSSKYSKLSCLDRLAGQSLHWIG